MHMGGGGMSPLISSPWQQAYKAYWAEIEGGKGGVGLAENHPVWSMTELGLERGPLPVYLQHLTTKLKAYCAITP